MNVLLIEDDPNCVSFVGEALARAWKADHEFFHEETLAAGIQHLRSDPPDIVLLDLSLPDSHGLGTLKELLRHAGSVPVVVLSELGDEKIALEAVTHGAQDYLVKCDVNERVLPRVIRYSVERKLAESESAGARLAAEASSWSKNEFLASLGTYLRTNLREICATVEELETAGSPRVGSLEPIRRCTESMLRVADRIGDLVRAEAFGGAAQDDVFVVGDIVNLALESRVHDLVEQGIQCGSWIDPRVPATLVGDGRRLCQVLEHLLGGVDGSGVNSVVARVEISGSASHPQLRFSVGMERDPAPPSKSKASGNPQANNEESVRARPEAGLELTIARRLAQLAGGSCGAGEQGAEDIVWCSLPVQFVEVAKAG